MTQLKVEVQHLAVLVGSSGGMVAQNAAVFMVKVEAQAAQAATLRGIPTSGLIRYSAADLDELQQLGESGLAYFWPGVSADVMKRALPCLPLPCVGFVEGAFMRNYVGPVSPVDTDHDFWPLAEGAQCDSTLLDAIRTAVPPRDRTQLFLKMWPNAAALPLEKLAFSF